MADMDVDAPFHSDGFTVGEWKDRMEQLQALQLEQRRRHIHLEPLYYGLPDLLFPKGFFPGKFDRSKMKVLRKRLNYEETDEQYAERQNEALTRFVTTKMFIAKDEKLIQIRLTPQMCTLLCDLFFGRVSKVILWANRGGGKSLLAALFIWIMVVYRKRSCINMGGAGNQARRVYDYTTQFWANVPGLQQGMLIRDPLMERTELKNGTRLICATSKSTAIGEHIGMFVADEASLLPSYQLLTSNGVREISGIRAGDFVLGREGVYQRTLEQFSHPYNGRILKIVPYGAGLTDWITEEHRVWAIKTNSVKLRPKRKLPHPDDCAGLQPDWIRAFDLTPGDVLCFPRMKKAPGTFEMVLEERTLSGPDLWRFLGYWAGDGGAPTGTRGAYPIKLHLSDAKLRFADDAETLLSRFSTGSVNRSQPPSRGSALDLVASSDKELWELLRNTVGLGEERGFPREWLEQATDEELRHWLRGYMRTDGNYEVSKTGALSAWCLTTTAEGLALNVIYALNRLGISCYYNKRSSRRYDIENLDRWDIKIRGHGAAEILEEVDLDGLRLPREQVPKAWFDEDWCYTLIREIEEDDYVGDVYDLKMDGDPSFGGPAFTMLHNCTDRPGGDGALMRSLQGCLSEPEPIVFLLSTFHLPVGFFADMWDNAEKQGFTQYRWDCFNTMQQCTAGLETATDQDPEALTFCHQTCPLTWTEPKRNSSGEIIGEEFVGCRGKARHSTGWMTRESILEAQRINAGTRIFPVEHACIRPRREGTIYDPEMIDRCITSTFNLILDRPLTVGIDWGLTECALVLIGEWRELDPENPERFVEGVGVLDVRFLQGQTTAAAVEVIQDWQIKYCNDEVRVRADGSHPYANHDLRHTWGMKVRGVTGDKGDMGKANVARWMGSGFLKILAGFDVFLEQLKNLRRDMVTGKQVKQNKADEEGDHGPDALRFALMNYDFVKWYKKAEQAAVDEEQPSSVTERNRGSGRTRRRMLPRAEVPRNRSWRGHGMADFLRM